jgi:membrane protein DedA with SNARE-associated domain
MSVVDALIPWVTRVLTAGGGWALGAVMLAENLFPPIPSEAVLPLAGFLVAQGTLDLPTALGMSTAGSLIGAFVLYALGRWGGRPVLYRWHRVLRVDERQLDRADAWFDRYGPRLVFWCRMVPIARSVISIPAGASEMPVGKFCALTAVGSLLWNAVLIGAGLALGRNWETVSRTVGAYSNAVLVALVLAMVAGAAFVILQRRRREA